MKEDIIKRFFLVKKNFQKFLNHELAKYDLKSSEAFFIQLLYKEGIKTQTELTLLANCNKSHTHRIILKLVEKNIIIVHEENPNHQMRNIKIELTNYGTEIAHYLEDKVLKKWENGLKNGLKQNEIEIAKKVINQIFDNSSKIIANLKQ